MGSTISNCKCILCDYEEAYSDYYYKQGEEYCGCPRCGSAWGYGHYGKDLFGEFKQEMKHAVKCGGKVLTCGGLTDSDITQFEKDVECNKKNLEVAQYTFKEKGVWFIKDCLSGKIIKWDDYEVARRV